MANIIYLPEEWKDVKDFEGLYKISSYGKIEFLSKGGGLLKTFIAANGYLNTRLFSKGQYKNFDVHVLVAVHYVPNPQNLKEVNHDDRNKLNNYYQNLHWCTHSENMLHRHATNESPEVGKLNKEQIFQIIEDRKRFKLSVLSEKYCVSVSTIHKICKGETYSKWFKEFNNERVKTN